MHITEHHITAQNSTGQHMSTQNKKHITEQKAQNSKHNKAQHKNHSKKQNNTKSTQHSTVQKTHTTSHHITHHNIKSTPQSPRVATKFSSHTQKITKVLNFFAYPGGASCRSIKKQKLEKPSYRTYLIGL